MESHACNADTALLAQAYCSLAEYADKHYQDLNDYIKSQDFESKKRIVDVLKEQASMTSTSKSMLEASRYIRI